MHHELAEGHAAVLHSILVSVAQAPCAHPPCYCTMPHADPASLMLTQAARVSADAVAAAVTLTNDCIKDGNAVEATSKAAASAWRSSQVSSCEPMIACATSCPAAADAQASWP